MDGIIGGGRAAAPAPAAGGDLIKDSDTDRFVDDVIQASHQVPVVVDFWAPWCGPCKQLTPALEKVVTLAGGTVKLVKINVDENQSLAGQLQIQSIPTVFAFKAGQPVDGFMGALPESQLKAFIEGLTGGALGPSPVEQLLELAAKAAEAGDPATAGQAFEQVLAQEPGEPKARAGLARLKIDQGDLEGAVRVLDEAPPEIAQNADIAGARAALKLAQDAANAPTDTGATQALAARLAANPADHEARLELATALIAEGRPEAGAEELLELVRRARQWNDEAARKKLVELFEAWGPTDPLTIDVRRRLSSILFA